MTGSSCVKTFEDAASSDKRRPVKKKRPPPLSIRFSDEERERLNRDAGNLSLSSYVRQKVLGDSVSPRRPHYAQKQRQPKLDHVAVAQLLGMFGQSELATSMIALALAAQSGAMPVTPELSEKLDQSCDDIRDMRVALIMALGIKPEDGG